MVAIFHLVGKGELDMKQGEFDLTWKQGVISVLCSGLIGWCILMALIKEAAL